MMKLVTFAALVGSTAAFAPTPVAKTTSALNAFESKLGAQPPFGFFDSLGLLDGANQERFNRLRYVEVKHGCIAQLAFLGNIITRTGIHISEDIDYLGHTFDSFPNGWAAINGPDAISGSGLAQIVFFVGTLELGVMKDSAKGAAPGDFPGDFHNGSLDLDWDFFNKETKLSTRAIKLNNGHAAMMGIL